MRGIVVFSTRCTLPSNVYKLNVCSRFKVILLRHATAILLIPHLQTVDYKIIQKTPEQSKAPLLPKQRVRLVILGGRPDNLQADLAGHPQQLLGLLSPSRRLCLLCREQQRQGAEGEHQLHLQERDGE